MQPTQDKHIGGGQRFFLLKSDKTVLYRCHKTYTLSLQKGLASQRLERALRTLHTITRDLAQLNEAMPVRCEPKRKATICLFRPRTGSRALILHQNKGGREGQVCRRSKMNRARGDANSRHYRYVFRTVSSFFVVCDNNDDILIQ